MQGKRILLIIGGGIAAYKCLELIRLIRKAGGAVSPVLTRAAEEFVTPLSAASLAGEKAYVPVLFEVTGNLVAPVVAHVGINALNLRWISNRYC